MKFAKILFFLSVIAFCSALERTAAEAKAAAEYSAKTKALRLSSGYKEMFQSMDLQTDANKNYDVTLIINNDKFPCELQMTLLNTNSFWSGIPFFSKTPITNLESHPVLKNFIQLNPNSFYLPFNSIQGGLQWDYSFGGISATISNTRGNNNLNIDFKDFADMDEEQRALETFSALENKLTERSTRNNKYINDLNRNLYQVQRAQAKIDAAQKSDADFKKAKEESIAKLKLEIQTLTTQLENLTKQKTTLSTTLQTSKNTETEITIQIKTLTIKKTNLLESIETLKIKISTQEVITNLEKKMTGDMEQLKYWLQGSIYHRIITQSEMDGLITSVEDSKKFTETVGGYFFPQ